MNRAWVTATVAAALLAGCALSGHLGGSAPRIPVGSELVVHQRLPLEAGDARVFLQDGAIVARSDLDRYRVACAIALRRRGAEALVAAVQPGRFIVIAGSRSRARSRPGHDDDRLLDPPLRLDYFTEMEIRSDLQPQIDALRCHYNGRRTTDDAPGVDAIRHALGQLATLALAHEQD